MSSDVYEVKPVEEKKDVEEIEYYRPTFWKRIFSILFDLLICFFISFSIFNLSKYIANNFTNLKDDALKLDEIRLESSLFVKDLDRVTDIVTYYNNSTDISYGAQELDLSARVDRFFTFLLDNAGQSTYEEALKYYDDFRLDPNRLYEDKSYFVLQDGEVVKNTSAQIPSKAYVQNIYSPFIDEYGQGLLVTRIPEYTILQKNLSIALIFIEIPISVGLGVIVVYYICPLILRRGRCTLGRLLFKIGLVDKNVLNVNWKVFTLRFLIFFFLEVVLSVFTLCIPFFISLSMMAFTKKKQTFHDYLLGIEEVDTTNSKIYYSLQEISMPSGTDDFTKFKMK